MAISFARILLISAAPSGTRSRPCQRISPSTILPGGIAISFSTESAVTVLPQPDSPTTHTRLAALDADIDAVDGLHDAVIGREMRLQPADFEERLAHGWPAGI